MNDHQAVADAAAIEVSWVEAGTRDVLEWGWGGEFLVLVLLVNF